jgi:hypothetical protein
LINTFLSPICIYRQGSLKKHYRSPGNTVHGAHTYITTHRNKNVNFDKIKYTCTCIFIVLVPLTKSVLKTAVHNHMPVGPCSTAPRAHVLRRH